MTARRALERASVPPPMFLLRTIVALALAAPPGAAPVLTPAARDYSGPDQTAAPETSPDPGAPVTAPSPDATAPREAPPIVPEPGDADRPATGEQPQAVVPQPVLPPPMTPQTEGPIDEPAVDELPYDPLVDSPEAIRARHWVRSGIVFMAVGGVLSIGAIAMSQAKVNDPETGAMPCNNRGDPAGNGCTLGGRQRSTAALAVPGALMLAGGIAMLTVGKLQQKRLAAALHADRRGFQIGLTLRF